MMRYLKNLLVFAVMAMPWTPALADGDIWIVTDSPHSVSDTVAKLEAIIEKAPPTLMAKIDHGANAEKAGMDLGESVLLIFGAPKVGTPIMQANKLAGLMLPARILVYDDGGTTRMAYIDPAAIESQFGTEAAAEQIAQMNKVLGKFTTKAAE
ncbi:MAG: hypothetical protein CSB44_07545 [Gammaproteobacteria bacterium]|nr:MAG: hypothetical protein CSB44_07545 [Gammaproteobacteria bacterium]